MVDRDLCYMSNLQDNIFTRRSTTKLGSKESLWGLFAGENSKISLQTAQGKSDTLLCGRSWASVCCVLALRNSQEPQIQAHQWSCSGLQRGKLLKPLQEKSELLNTVKEDFDQTAENIEVQARDTERQIKDVFSILHEFLQKEERARIGSLRDEKQRKSRMLKRKTNVLSREIATLSETIRETDEALEAENISFLRNYSAAAQRVQHSLPGVEELTPEALIDTDKHLSNLSFAILDSMKDMIFSTFKPEPCHPSYLQAPAYYDNHRVAQTRRPMSLALPESQARELSHMLDNKVFPPPLANPLFPCQPAQASVSSNVLGNAGGWDLRPAATSVCNEEKSKRGKKFIFPNILKQKK